jgi:hypothetical protein
MKKVWKFELTQSDNKISLPFISQFLSVKVQNGAICLWALVEDTNHIVDRRVLLIGTGHPVPEDGVSYIDTVLLHDDSLVLHAFEVLQQ